jgi:transposase
MVAGQHVGRDKSMAVLAQFFEGSGKPAIPRNARGKFSISRAELLVQYDNLVKELGGDLAQFCRARNHDILLTPPRASDFQPIELFWACCKNAVAAKYTSTRSMETVKEQIMSEFDKWGTAEHCSKLIEHCTKKIQKHHDLIVNADASAEQAQVFISDNDDEDASDDSVDDDDQMSHSDDEDDELVD